MIENANEKTIKDKISNLEGKVLGTAFSAAGTGVAFLGTFNFIDNADAFGAAVFSGLTVYLGQLAVRKGRETVQLYKDALNYE